MAVNWGLAGPGFNALESLQVAGQAQLRAQQERARALQLEQAQREQMAERAVGGRLAAGDFAGARQTAYQQGGSELWKHLDSLDEARRKATTEGFKQLGEYALLADTPEKWDQYVQGFVAQGHPEAAGYLGQFNLRGQILAQAGLAKEYADQQKVDYKVVPQGGYLQGFRADGQPIGDVQTAPPPVSAPSAAAAPEAAVQYLRQNPGMAAQFDAKYGQGAAARAMGGAPSQGGATFS